jgi:hypothetical protein
MVRSITHGLFTAQTIVVHRSIDDCQCVPIRDVYKLSHVGQSFLYCSSAVLSVFTASHYTVQIYIIYIITGPAMKKKADVKTGFMNQRSLVYNVSWNQVMFIDWL